MRRRAAVLSLLAGVALMAVAQLAAPLGSPPLYDGVVVQEPYRYLAPTQGQAGSPTSYHASPSVQGTTSPQLAAATTESPPQAQLIAPPGAFVLPAGITTLTVSIDPVAGPPPPSSGPIASNVYRYSVADQAGAALAINPAMLPTLVLRAPDGIVAATIARFSGGAWLELATQLSGQPGIFLVNVTSLGDFAVIALPTPGLFGLDPTLLGLAAATVVVSVVALGLLVSRNRGRATAVRAVSRQRRPRPSKRGRRRRGGSR